MSEKELDIDDQELFDSTISDEPVEEAAQIEEVAQEAEANQSGQPRDDAGRFAAKDAGAENEPESQTNQDDRIPQWRRDEIAAEKHRAVDRARELEEQLAQERADRAAMERRLEALEKPQKAEQAESDLPDPLIDPVGYGKAVREQIRNEMLTERREESLQRAHEKYQGEFQEAYKAAQERVDPALRAKMQASRDPGETLVAWYRERKTLSEIGNDPNAWLEKKLEERMKDPAFVAKVLEQQRGSAPARQADGRPNISLPPSLNGMSRSNAALRSISDNVSDQELFDSLTN